MSWVAKLIKAFFIEWFKKDESADPGLDPAVLKQHKADLEELIKIGADVEQIRAKRQIVGDMTFAQKQAALRDSRK